MYLYLFIDIISISNQIKTSKPQKNVCLSKKKPLKLVQITLNLTKYVSNIPLLYLIVIIDHSTIPRF